MRSYLCGLLVLVLVVPSSTVSLLAQSPSQTGAAIVAAPVSALPASSQPPTSDESLAIGMRDGELLGGEKGTLGKLGAGVAVGVFTNILGTGIGYFLIGPEPMTPDALQKYSNADPAYRTGFKTGWEQKTGAESVTRSLLVA